MITGSFYKSIKANWPTLVFYHRVATVCTGSVVFGKAVNNYYYAAEAPRGYRPTPEDHRENLAQLVLLAELSDWFLSYQLVDEEP